MDFGFRNAVLFCYCFHLIGRLRWWWWWNYDDDSGFLLLNFDLRCLGSGFFRRTGTD